MWPGIRCAAISMAVRFLQYILLLLCQWVVRRLIGEKKDGLIYTINYLIDKCSFTIYLLIIYSIHTRPMKIHTHLDLPLRMLRICRVECKQ